MDLNLNRSIFKGLIITIIILIFISFFSNLAWVIAWVRKSNEYNTVVTTEETKTVEDIESAGDIIQY